MSKRDDAVYLRDILDAIAQIEAYLQGVSFDTFCEEGMRQDAVVRQLEIVGEASRNLSQDFQDRHPEVPWQDIVRMRHKIAHDYFEVDVRIVWDTARSDLPMLRPQVERIVHSTR